MKLNDHDRGTPSVCRASIVTRLVIPHSHSQLLKNWVKGQRSRAPRLPWQRGPIKATAHSPLNALPCTKELLVQRGRDENEAGRLLGGGPSSQGFTSSTIGYYRLRGGGGGSTTWLRPRLAPPASFEKSRERLREARINPHPQPPTPQTFGHFSGSLLFFSFFLQLKQLSFFLITPPLPPSSGMT